MESTTVKLYSLNYGNVRTYLAASLFSLVIHRWQHPFSPIFSSHTARRNNLAAYLFLHTDRSL